MWSIVLASSFAFGFRSSRAGGSTSRPSIATRAFSAPVPELPELQALAEGLAAALAGREIAPPEPGCPSMVKTRRARPLDARWGIGHGGRGARGKISASHAGRASLAIHLMQGGRLGLRRPAARAPPPAGCFSRWVTGGEELRLREPSTEHRATVHVLATGRPFTHHSGRWRPWVRSPSACRPAAWRERAGTALGAPAHGPARRATRGGHRPRCYASEIMWAARLAPFAAADRLTDDEIARLAASGRCRAGPGARSRARADRDTAFPTARSASRPRIATRASHACAAPRSLERVSFSGYELVYCPDCQNGGRVSPTAA